MIAHACHGLLTVDRLKKRFDTASSFNHDNVFIKGVMGTFERLFLRLILLERVVRVVTGLSQFQSHVFLEL